MSTTEQIDTSNVFVKFLPPDLSEQEFFELFSNFGEIVSSKIMVDQTSGNSLGYGFVRYATEEEALESIRKMNGQRVSNKRLLCKLANQSTGFPQKNPLLARVLPSNNLYIKPLLIDTTEEDLREAFGVFGEILDCKVMIDKRTGQSRQIGFVRYGTVEEAQDAIEEMNGCRLSEHSLPLVVKFADSKEQKDIRKKLRTRKSQDFGNNEIIYGSQPQPYPGMATSPYSYMYYPQSPPMYGSPPMYYPYGSYPPPVYDVNMAGYGYGYQYPDYGYVYGTTPEYGYAEYGYGITPPEYGYPAYGYNTVTEEQNDGEEVPDHNEPDTSNDSVDAEPEANTESSTTQPIPIQRKR